jgi:hypothetical protein
MSKKGSLNLSINAVVVIVLAITMLGLGLAFIRGMFAKGLGSVAEQFDEIEQQRVDSLIEKCDEELCLEKRTVNMVKSDEEHVFLVVYNKFDCPLDGSGTNGVAEISVGGVQGGNQNFGPAACDIIGGVGTAGNCNDIMIQTLETKPVGVKQKEAVRLIIKTRNTAKPTVYHYPVSLQGQCSVSGQTFDLTGQKTLEINIEG